MANKNAATNQDSNASALNWNIGTTIYIGSRSEGYGIYQKQLDSAIEYCGEIVASIKENNQKRKEKKSGNLAQTEQANTVIGILGERGSGKSSFLYTLRNSLEDEMPEAIYALDVIDPTNFGTNLSGLELFLASLYKEARKLNDKHNRNIAIEDFPRLAKRFKEITKTLSDLRRDDGDFRKENPNTEVLDYMANITNMRNTIYELCKAFLDFTNDAEAVKKQCIAVFFDDVDLIDNDKIVALLQDIRKFLSGNVIVILTYRERQLIESLENEYLQADKPLLDTGQIEVLDIHQRVLDTLEKIIPTHRRLRLYDQTKMLDSRLIDVLGAVADDETMLERELIDPYDYAQCQFSSDMTVKEWIESTILAKTEIRIVPFNRNEETTLLWPRNLRELIPLAIMIQEDMKHLDKRLENYFDTWLDNLNKFDEYFQSKVHHTLSESYASDFAKWHLADYGVKNYVAYASMLSKLDTQGKASKVISLKKMSDLLDIGIVRPENVTLGDISKLSNRLISLAYEDDTLRFYGYAFKMTYSIALLRLLLEAITYKNKAETESISSDINRYLSLLNVCPITPERGSTQFSLVLYKPTAAQIEAYRESVSRLDDRAENENLEPIMEKTADSSLFLAGIDDFLGMFACTSDPANGYTARASRPKLESDIHLNTDQSYSRKIFTLNDSRLDATHDEQDQENETWISGNEYWISTLYILGNKNYVNRAVANASKHQNSYLLYSLFDIDIFNFMTTDQKGRTYRTFVHQIRRLNTAIAMAGSRFASDNLKNISENPYLMDVKRTDEREAYTKLCIPFVLDSSYLLFNPERIDINDRELMFRCIDQITDAEKSSLRRINIFVKRSSRDDIKRFLEHFYLWVVRARAEASIQEEVRELREVLNKGARLMPRTRDRLNGIVDSCPSVAIAAYREYLNE